MTKKLSLQCNICGSTGISHSIRRTDGASVVFCSQCGMGVVDPIPEDLTHFYTQDYYEAGGGTSEGYANYAEMAEHGVSWAAATVQALVPSGSVLDIGCADGHLLKKLGDSFQPFGIEVNERAASEARSAEIKIIGDDLFDPKLLENYRNEFDVVTSIATFEHLRDFRGGISAALAFLKPKGLLLFEVPLISEIHNNDIWFSSSHEHVYYPTVRSLRNLFDDILDVPMVGTELYVASYASTYIGIAALRSEYLKDIQPIWHEIFSEKTTICSPASRRARALVRVVHGAHHTVDDLSLLDGLTPLDITPPLMRRLSRLWEQDVSRLQNIESDREYHRTQAKGLAGNLAALRERERELAEKLSGLEATWVATDDRNRKLELMEAINSNAVEALRTENHQLQLKVAQCAGERDALERTLASAGSTLEDTIRAIREQIKEALASRAEVDLLKKEVAAAEFKAQYLQTENNQLQLKVARCAGEQAALERTLAFAGSARKETIHAIREQITEALASRAEVDLLKEEVAAAEFKAQSLKAELDCAAIDRAYAKELMEARDWHARQAENWSSEYSRAAAEIRELRKVVVAQPVRPNIKRVINAAKHPVRASKIVALKAIDRLSRGSPERATRMHFYARRTWSSLTFRSILRKQPDVVAPLEAFRNDFISFDIERHPRGKPLVSVVIPCFNYGRYVQEAVDSVRAQTFKDIEIIVVDGGSTDTETREIVRSLQKDGVRVYLRRERHRVGSNRNFGINRASGKYICCLDADDQLAPTYIEKAVFLLEAYRYDVASTSVEMFGATSSTYGVAEAVDLDLLLSGNHVPTAAVFRKVFWEKIGGYRDHGDGSPATHIHEDWEFWIRIAAAGAKFFNVEKEHLFRYRIHHNGSLSNRPDMRSNDDQIAVIRELNEIEITQSAVATSISNRLKNYKARDIYVNLPRDRSREANQKSLIIALPWMVIGGAERLLSNLLSKLRYIGWKISIVTTLTPSPLDGDTTGWFAEYTDDIFQLPKYLAPERWADFLDYLIVSRGANGLLVAGSAFTYEQLPALKAHHKHLHVCDLLFNTVGHTQNNRRFANFIDMNIVENAEVADWLENHGETRDRIAVIPSGIDLESYHPSSNLTSVRESLGIGPSEFLVGFSGRWSAEKNPLGFIEIARGLSGNSNIHFVMTGTGNMAEEILSALATATELNGRFHLLGKVDDVKPVMSAFDVLVVPSTLDGRPVVVLESLALGIPVVASRVGGLPELVIPGQNGELCVAGDVAAFVAAIGSLERNREQLVKYKLKARTFAEENLSEMQMVKKYAKALLPHRVFTPTTGTTA